MELGYELREIRDGEAGSVKALYRRALNPLDALIFGGPLGDSEKKRPSGKGTSFVVVVGEKITGTVTTRIKDVKGESVGFVDSFCVDKALRGKGAGSALISKAVSNLTERGCDLIYASVDRYNSRSWNVFVKNGFRPAGVRELVGLHGAGALKILAAEGMFFAPGSFLMKYDSKGREGPRPWGSLQHFVLAWAFFTAAMSLLVRFSAPFDLWTLITVAAAALTTMVVHEGAHVVVAALFRKRFVYRAWDAGQAISLLLPLIGSLYPLSGSVYFDEKTPKYDSREKSTIAIYAAGILASAVVSFVLNVVGGSTFVTQTSFFCLLFAAFNLIPFHTSGGFPWDGRKIWPASKVTYVICVAVVVGAYLIPILM